MELSEKLQQLRKQSGMTQEQLADRLYVSRTAVSKWETGGGYPNLGSLQDIAALFDITVDDLLSGKEIIRLAKNEADASLERLLGMVFGVLDVAMLSFFFLPLFGMEQEGFIAMVSLIDYSGPNQFLYLFSSLFVLLALVGVLELTSALLRKDRLSKRAMLASIALHALAVLAFIMTRDPYAAGLLFVLLFVKAALLLYKNSKLSR